MTSGNELNALVSAYIDGERLDAREQQLLDESLRAPGAVRNDVTLLSAVRKAVRDRAPQLRQEAPTTLQRAVLAGLDEIDATSSRMQRTQRSWSLADAWRSLSASPRYVQGLVALGSVVVIVLTALVATRTGTGSQELSALAYEQYQSITSGSFDLGLKSSDREALKGFFASQGVEFEVFFPGIHASLVGGSVVDVDGKKCAQLVYAAGSKRVYLLETDNDDIVDGSVRLDKEISDDVALSRWHWEERADVGTMFVWKSNNVMCTAVSDMPTNEFSALFQLETL